MTKTTRTKKTMTRNAGNKISGTFKFRFDSLLREKEFKDDRKYTYKDIKELTKSPELPNGIATSTITDWAKGDVKYLALSTLAAFCKFFNCKVSDLIEFIPD